MYKQCQTEESTKRQRLLELGLLRAMEKQRYDDISISDLCVQLNITRKTFYRYFSGKDGCLFALLDHTMLDFFHHTPHFQKASTGTALGDLEAFFQFWYHHRDLLHALQKSSMSGLLVERATQLAIRERLMPKSILNRHITHQQLVMSFAVSGLYSMIAQWYAGGFSVDPAQMAHIATQLITQPLISR